MGNVNSEIMQQQNMLVFNTWDFHIQFRGLENFLCWALFQSRDIDVPQTRDKS